MSYNTGDIVRLQCTQEQLDGHGSDGIIDRVYEVRTVSNVFGDEYRLRDIETNKLTNWHYGEWLAPYKEIEIGGE